MSYQSKECCLCKKKFVLNSPTQKYCEGCRPIIVKEQNRQRCKHWYFKHPDEAKKRIKQCRENNPEKYKETQKRMKSKRRYLGFIPLNKYEENFESHHIDKINVIYMPKETHRSIFHNIWTGRNMDVINVLAQNYLNYEDSIPATS